MYKTSLLSICAETSQIGFDAIIEIGFANLCLAISILRFRMED